MAQVLVVDDSPDQAQLIADLLESFGYSTETAPDGNAALDTIARTRPDIVLTDLVMPGLSGLDLVEAVTRNDPTLPVILLTAHGNGEIAMQALKKGAASYVPKRLIGNLLRETVENTLELTRAKCERTELLHALDESEFRYVLPSNPSLINPLVSFVQDSIAAFCRDEAGEIETMQIGVALQEALNNAIHHGNLEVSSTIKDLSWREYQEAIEQRQTDPRYRDRRVHLSVSVCGKEITFGVRDEGTGFDVSSVPDPTDPKNLERSHGRGLYLIEAFMSAVEFGGSGNEITMVKRLGEETTDEGPRGNMSGSRGV